MLGTDERFRGKFKKKEGNTTGLSIKKVPQRLKVAGDDPDAKMTGYLHKVVILAEFQAFYWNILDCLWDKRVWLFEPRFYLPYETKADFFYQMLDLASCESSQIVLAHSENFDLDNFSKIMIQTSKGQFNQMIKSFFFSKELWAIFSGAFCRTFFEWIILFSIQFETTHDILNLSNHHGGL